jgi:hypothetical protein
VVAALALTAALGGGSAGVPEVSGGATSGAEAVAVADTAGGGAAAAATGGADVGRAAGRARPNVIHAAAQAAVAARAIKPHRVPRESLELPAGEVPVTLLETGPLVVEERAPVARSAPGPGLEARVGIMPISASSSRSDSARTVV